MVSPLLPHFETKCFLCSIVLSSFQFHKQNSNNWIEFLYFILSYYMKYSNYHHLNFVLYSNRPLNHLIYILWLVAAAHIVLLGFFSFLECFPGVQSFQRTATWISIFLFYGMKRMVRLGWNRVRGSIRPLRLKGTTRYLVRRQHARCNTWVVEMINIVLPEAWIKLPTSRLKIHSTVHIPCFIMEVPHRRLAWAMRTPLLLLQSNQIIVNCVIVVMHYASQSWSGT